jgi:hypothetical protein
MLKKFISMTTAVLLMASGISFVGATAANASTTTVTLSTITFRGAINPSTNVFDSLPGADRSTIGASFIGGGEQWQTATLTWSPSISNNRFASGTVYTATFYLSPRNGWNINGLSTSFFTVAGATSVLVSYDAGSPREWAFVTVVFPAAGSGSSSSSSSSSSQQSSEQTQAAAAAAAAAAFGAGQKLTKTVSAQQNLSSAFLGSKPGSIEDFRSANINVTTTASLIRINAEILKLSAIDRTDFAKIKALAEKIEFDESFFNASSRPTAATYAAYGVPGVTERVVAKVNEKVLALPAAQRLDTKAITEIANVESFVDRVANTATRSTVSTNLLISKRLVPADYPKKHSLLLGLSRYPEGSLNTMAKIEAAIKEQIAKAEAPRLRTVEIRARIAARRG